MHRQLQLGLVLATCVLLTLSFIRGEHPRDQPLLHVPTIVALVGLWWMARRGSISDVSMACIVLFLWLHILGARYVYSFVPYDDWCETCFGVTLSDECGLTRNHYDRFVHFAYGVLAMVPQVELLRRAGGLKEWSACVVSVAFVLAAGALYEIFEWALTLAVDAASAARYNGQQGDVWDAQKDMAAALLGAVLMGLAMMAVGRRTVDRSPR